jgi:hypothetical protein
MLPRRALALALPLAVVGAIIVATPAGAAQQSGLGTTLDVTIQPGAQSALEETTWVPNSGGAVIFDTGANVAADTTMTVTEGVTELASCTITTGNAQCGDGIPALSDGAHNVTYTFDNGTDSVVFSGVIFSVSADAPSVGIEWQDADGDWIDGSGTSIPLFASASTAVRCVVTNNGNAPATFSSFSATVSHPVGPATVVPITGTLAAGATQAFPLWSGLVSDVSSVGCSGGVTFPAGSGTNGNGQGGGITPISGTLSVSDTSVSPGDTVTVNGAGLFPPMSTEYHVTVNGAAAPGSPTTLVMPAGSIDFDVVFPTAGTYTLAVHNGSAPGYSTFATFTITVVAAAEIADTGVDATATLVIAGSLIATGVAFLAISRRATRRETRHT